MLKIGLILLGAAAFCLLYIAGRLARTVIAWGNNEPGPKERIGFYLAIAAMAGAFAGWLAYEPYLTIDACKAAGEPILACALQLH